MAIRNEVRIEEVRKRPASAQPKRETVEYKTYDAQKVNNARNKLNDYYTDKKKINENEEKVNNILNKYRNEERKVEPILMSMDKNIDFHELDQFSPPNNINNIEYNDKQSYKYSEKPIYEPMYKKEVSQRPSSAKMRTVDYDNKYDISNERNDFQFNRTKDYKVTNERTKDDIIREYEQRRLKEDRQMEFRAPTPDRRNQPRQGAYEYTTDKTNSRERTPERIRQTPDRHNKDTTPNRVNDHVYVSKYESNRKKDIYDLKNFADNLNFNYSKRDTDNDKFKLDTNSKSYLMEKLARTNPANNYKVKYI